MQNNKSMFGIIVPVLEEAQYLQKAMTETKQINVAGIHYLTGRLHGKNVVVVISGLGTISAAIVATRLICDFNPTLLLVFGSSGNINSQIHKNHIVIGATVINADLGELTKQGTKFIFNQYLKNPQTDTNLPLEFHLSPNLMQLVSELSKQQPNIILGKIATSDALPNHAAQIELLQQAGFDVVEMEGAAVMQTCWMFNKPGIVVRGVSNDAKEDFTVEDIAQAAQNATNVVMKIIQNYKLNVGDVEHSQAI